MRKETAMGRSRVRRQQAIKLMLLALPVLFWSIVFATLAGARLPAGIADALSDVAQSLIALACLLLIALRLPESAFFEMPESIDIFFSEGGNQT